MTPSQVKSAARAIEILELFKRVRRSLSMSDIAADLGYPQSSTTVLLKTLVSLGYLNFDRSGRVYFPTPKVTALGDWVPHVLFGNSRVFEAMQELHTATGEGISISTKNDIYLQYIRCMFSTHPLRFDIDEGTLRPLTQSGVGWTLLSTLPDDKIDNIVRRANLVTEKSSRVSVGHIMQKVGVIRRDGFCYAEHVPFLGGATICMLLPLQIQNQPVVLTLGGIAERIRANHDRYLDVLRRIVASLKPADPFDEPIDIEF